MFRKNTSGQFIHFQGVDSSTGGIKSGVTWTVRRCIDGTFAAATGTVTEDSTNGWYKFAMSQADTNGNNIAFNFTGTGAVPQTVNILTDGSPPDVNLKNAAGTAVTLDANSVLNVSTKYLAGTSLTGRDIGASVLLSAGTGTGQLDFTSGVVKANVTQFGGSNGTFASGRPEVNTTHWLGTACSTPTVAGVPNVNTKTWNDLATVALPLVPTTAGRTLDVSAGGEAGVDWANVGSPTTSLSLSGTTIANLTNAPTSGDLTSTMKTSVENAVWNAALSSHTTPGSAGAGLSSASSAGDPWSTAVPGAYSSGTAGYILGNNLNAAVSAVKAKTDNLPASPAAVGSAMTLSSAYDFAKGTVAVTESYNTDGAAPTPVQALMMIMQMLTEKSVASTTLTVKKLDGSSSAATFTLNDATAPTSITRAT